MADKYIFYNRIKRERMRKEEIRNTICQMRKDLPNYNLEEIREHKMPFYDALITNLNEKGMISSASFVEQLVEFQTRTREEAGPGSNIWMRPQLRYSEKELKYLSNELQKAEEFNLQENHLNECDIFLKLGIHFAFSHQDWWWLGEQILVQSINVSGGYPSLQGKFEALSRFAYAKFLITNLKEYDNAKEQLFVARDLCKSKGQNIELYFPDEKGTLYMKINYYTYKCLIKEARSLMSMDYRKAIEMAVLAKKRAAEACHKEGETKALLLKGLCEMNIDEAKNAILSFNKALKLQENKEDKEGLCIVMIQLAKAYLMDNNASQSLRILNSLKDTAATYKLHFYLAEAYKNMGEHYLNNREYSIARKLLNKSLNLFEQEKDASSDIALVQILEAVAWGLELFPKYVDLVYNASNTTSPLGIENLKKLIDWKDCRKTFWENIDEDHHSFVDMMAADCQTITPSTVIIQKYREERKATKECKKIIEDESVKQEINQLKVNEDFNSVHVDKETCQDKNGSNEKSTISPELAKEQQINIIELHSNKNNFSISGESVNVDESLQPPTADSFSRNQ